MVQANDPKEIKKHIEHSLHMIAFDARMIVEENPDITEQDMRAFIAEKGNEEFNAVFSVSKEQFMAMTVIELLKLTLIDSNSDMT